MFSDLSKTTLAKAVVFKDSPVYVQFYVTARCNLTCEQCNIIYANSDVREASLDEIKLIAENFAKMGVAIVLLTGGEPFARKDLPDIIYAFESRGVHVRMQTNGFASEEQIAAAVEAGGRDISISLDSLDPAKQDRINGGFADSWHQAMRAMALFSQYLPSENSFASLGCVMQPYNLGSIEDIIRFGTEISWFTSLVPAHVTDNSAPRGFRTFDQSLKFRPEEMPEVEKLLAKVKTLKKQGFLLYDSEEYLDDILRFCRDEPTTWRRKNKNVCDSPNLYFALLPSGDFAPCCDFRIDGQYAAYKSDFSERYKSKTFRDEVLNVTQACDGCMYGSYPEITIAMRYPFTTLSRVKTFLAKPPKKKWPLTYEDLLTTAEKIVSEPRYRAKGRGTTNAPVQDDTAVVRILGA